MGILGGQFLQWMRLDAAPPSQCSPACLALGNGRTSLPFASRLLADVGIGDLCTQPLCPIRSPIPHSLGLISCTRNEQTLLQYLMPRVTTGPYPSLFPQAVKRFLKLECKCHGVSGSCTLRTCWLAMSDFRKTGDYLRRKYNGAIQVTMNQDGTGFTVANKNFRKPTKTDLVYFENSPDYCVMDKSAGKTWSSSHYPKASLVPSQQASSSQLAQPVGSAPQTTPVFGEGVTQTQESPQHPTPAQAGLRLSPGFTSRPQTPQAITEVECILRAHLLQSKTPLNRQQRACSMHRLLL